MPVSTELLLELTTLLTVWLCLAAWQRDRTARGRRLFMALCAAVLLWSAGNLVLAHGHASPLEARRLSYLGILTLPALGLWLALVVRGARIVERAPAVPALLLAPGLAGYALLFHTPVLSAELAHFATAGELPRGTSWWLGAGYAWALCLLACFQLGRSVLRLRARGARQRRIAVALGALLPLGASVAYATTGAPGLDTTPMLLAAWLVALRGELFSGDLLEALPVAHHDLVSQLPTPLILTDLEGHITEINPAALDRLGMAKADALGRNVDALLEGTAFAPEFERWSLVAAGREAGSILLPAEGKPNEDGP